MPKTAAPGGELFIIALLALAAHFGGILMVKITTLPALIGMLLVGILMQNVGWVNLPEDSHLPKELRYKPFSNKIIIKTPNFSITFLQIVGYSVYFHLFLIL